VSIDEKGDQLVPSEDIKSAATPSGDIVFSTVTAGARHACGLVVDLGPDLAGHMADATAWCWGDNSESQLGVSSSPPCNKPGSTFPCERLAVQVQGPGGGTPLRFQQIAAGGEFTCGVADPAQGGQIHCWGRNDVGQLGNGTTVDSAEPVQVLGDLGSAGVLVLTVGDAHACALTAAGVAYCWGGNAAGQLGDSTTGQGAQPVAVVGGHVFTGIAAGTDHTCGVVSTAGTAFAPADLDGGGPIYCWGSNQSTLHAGFGGKLGTGNEDGGGMLVNSLFPVRIAEPEDVFF
jgi:alpha-tubulin suppressor-like RCC1 family protein